MAAEELPRSPLTKLVTTIGPASEEKEPLEGCVAAGMNVMRVNFSHATVEEFHLRRNNLRNAPGGEYVAVMLDTKGPEIRMGGLKVCKESGNRKAKIHLAAGAPLDLTTDKAFDGASDESTLFVDYPRIGKVVSAGDKVLLDDGLISLEVVSVERDDEANALIKTTVLNSSEIGERKGINLPGVATGLPAMSDKDKVDIKFGIENDIDMVAASFVRSAAGVHEIREYMRECVREARGLPADEDGVGDYFIGDNSLPLIISKIESTEALEDLFEIVDASDGVMVARGDLGVEVPIETVVTWQKEMVELSTNLGKPVVVATQMLESMQKNPRPTRAEVADVTNAVLEGADAVMLSGESANGQYPIESVAMQAAICANAEAWAASKEEGPGGAAKLPELGMFDGPRLTEAGEMDYSTHIARAACALAQSVDAAAVLVCEEAGDGQLTREVARFRPPMPIVALCDSVKICRQLAISRGVQPLLVEEAPEDEADFGLDPLVMTQEAYHRTSLLGEDDTVVCVIDDTISVEFVGRILDLDDMEEEEE